MTTSREEKSTDRYLGFRNEETGRCVKFRILKRFIKSILPFSQVITTYRYGREEDEVMGVKFSKEMIIAREQIVPFKKEKQDTTPIQDRLMKRLGPNAYPFTFEFPAGAPSSVTLQPGDDDTGKPLGVEYTVKIYVGENEEDKVREETGRKIVSWSAN